MENLRTFLQYDENVQKVRNISLICTLLAIAVHVSAQPSGGPYGPIQQTYDLPDVKGSIYYVAPDGKAEASGNTIEKPTTLEAAFEQVTSGDAIVLRGGTYRTGNLQLNQGITMLPYKDEQPVLKGTYVASEWEALSGGLWRTSWTHLFPEKPAGWWRKERHIKFTPLHRFNNDMVFVDGKFLQSAGYPGEVTEDTYYIDYENGEVYIGIDPNDKLVEITTFNVAINRTTRKVHGKESDGIGPVIKGITFTQYAYRALDVQGYFPEGLSDESEHGKEVTGTTLEHSTISYCSRVAAYLLGDHLTIRHCKISHTSTEGIYIMSSSDVLLEKNIFTKNNIERITGYYPAAVKIFNQSYRVTCNDNLVKDLPYSNGIWYDVGNVDGVFTNNILMNVGNLEAEFTGNSVWPSQNAFFFEISKGAVCAGNIFVNCDHGILVLNSSDVQIYQNTFINSMTCFGRDERSAEGDHFGWHPSTGPGVEERTGHIFVNNLLASSVDFDRPLLFVWQPEKMCERLQEPALKELNHNAYVPGNDDQPIVWLNQLMQDNCEHQVHTTQGLGKLKTGYGVNSTKLVNYQGPMFKAGQLGNYEVFDQFPGQEAAKKLPDNIQGLIGTSVETPYIGAYPPVKLK